MYLIITYIAKVINSLINFLKLGSGGTWPGYVGLSLYPKLWSEIPRRVSAPTIFITGTNGKTTTAKLLVHMLEQQGKRVLSNVSGANLLNGIASTFLLGTDLKGQLRYDVIVLEVDELTLPLLLQKINPKAVALLNLSRDQLDRYWETDLVCNRWKDVLQKINHQPPTLVVDCAQKEFRDLVEGYLGNVLYFDDDREALKNSALIGEYNAKNINCALQLISILGVSQEDATRSLASFSYAFGRGEVINFCEKEFRVMLAKNPESLNQNLRAVIQGGFTYDAVLFLLNDLIPDGHDVSWVYDVDQELIYKVCVNKEVFVSGLRSYDMAIRIGYAGVAAKEINTASSIDSAIKQICTQNEISKVLVLPNYSAMLQIRKILIGRKIL